jgi:LmbE family N-acetylglucosaminyl deacetylase
MSGNPSLANDTPERRILTIYAHPDDAEIWAGGTLLAHQVAGDQVAMCVLTHGDSPRAEEARQGAELLGAALHHLAFPDRALRFGPETIEAVLAVLRATRPGIVLTHWPEDFHPDHVAAWEITRAAITLVTSEIGRPAVFWSDTYGGLGVRGPFAPDCLVDVTAVWDRKREAIQAHRSQNPDQYLHMAELQCGLHGVHGQTRYAEGYIRVPFFSRGRMARPSLWEHL